MTSSFKLGFISSTEQSPEVSMGVGTSLRNQPATLNGERGMMTSAAAVANPPGCVLESSGKCFWHGRDRHQIHMITRTLCISRVTARTTIRKHGNTDIFVCSPAIKTNFTSYSEMMARGSWGEDREGGSVKLLSSS